MEFWKTIVIFETNTLEFVRYEFLTYIVNFGTESDFCKYPRSTFSDSPGPGPGPL